MTAQTSEMLATVLEAAGLHDMAKLARLDHYHDYLSDDAMCSLTLEADLRAARDAQGDPILKAMVEAIRQRHLNGDFDASQEESDAWAASPEGQAAFRSLIEKK